MKRKLVIVMMGLPARGKSTMARKLGRTLELDGVRVRIFNNGELRRRLDSGTDTSSAAFFSPANIQGVEMRERIAQMNIEAAQTFFSEGGEVAIMDASNVTRRRRQHVADSFPGVPLCYIECLNADEEALEANLERKVRLKEFQHLTHDQALESFIQRIRSYESIYEPLDAETNRIVVDSFESCILQEHITDVLPYYDRIRDILTTRVVRNLFLVRHGETLFNQEDRIGGDSDLTGKGREQANALAEHFATVRIPIIFTSNYKRTLQTATPIAERQHPCSIIALPEFNEIYAGQCEGMTYEEVRQQMPDVAKERGRNKYSYVYPDGEGYMTMEERVLRGLKKVFFLNNYSENIMIVGHRAVNRVILSCFLSRQEEEIPYIYMPQDRYYHIQIDPHKRIFELIAYRSIVSGGISW
ncbi:bifunctional nucleoside/nucleotide kinase/histidine phosphatase family protein [Desulfobulbus oligotrophicus]|jgi:broad specificity phosphatase PhoE/predicted kinase|uniref:Histidine phosphatase family protein n=1 Tax=Desulfobulbus oligotrophicus TaxID=1909699 RepID=A0A7T5VDT1_9BACT|nr:6-phosphofructo-2-kinase/fructose-2,6-bisphosphatase [Desulfobulbus oligotrophicus]MDY0389440.1 6-phosphofructo-2-kinase/fructose-2,6-bisphosphatase [Desulfobulbus oligotrophicus]QQG65919.1 histidine phosphatase family protein [Desulfobulbus oligotrophicus]